MLVSVVTETESDVLKTTERRTLGAALLTERDIIAPNELVEFNSIVGRLTLAIGRQNEDGQFILWELVEIVKVEIFEICRHRLQSESRGALLR